MDCKLYSNQIWRAANLNQNHILNVLIVWLSFKWTSYMEYVTESPSFYIDHTVIQDIKNYFMEATMYSRVRF